MCCLANKHLIDFDFVFMAADRSASRKDVPSKDPKLNCWPVRDVRGVMPPCSPWDLSTGGLMFANITCNPFSGRRWGTRCYVSSGMRCLSGELSASM